jgi:hypothetical protein
LTKLSRRVSDGSPPINQRARYPHAVARGARSGERQKALTVIEIRANILTSSLPARKRPPTASRLTLSAVAIARMAGRVQAEADREPAALSDGLAIALL